MEEMKVVFHIVAMKKWDLVLANVSNLLEDAQDTDLKVEVIANSAAVKYYDTIQDIVVDLNTLMQLNEKGVRFVACNNALNANNIEKHNLLDFVSVVPAGVSEIVRKQHQGYAYIRP